MTKFYKAVRLDGTAFHGGAVHYTVGSVVRHPNPGSVGGEDAGGYLSVSTSPTDCTGMSWPCMLLEVEVGECWAPHEDDLPNKRATHELHVIRQLPAHDALGPQGVHVTVLIERARSLSDQEIADLYAAWDAARYAARDAARDAARYAARDAARYAAWDAARYAARDAAGALVVRDLIGSHGFTQEHYDTLTGPWRKIIGAIHPDDADLRVEAIN